MLCLRLIRPKAELSVRRYRTQTRARFLLQTMLLHPNSQNATLECDAVKPQTASCSREAVIPAAAFLQDYFEDISKDQSRPHFQ